MRLVDVDELAKHDHWQKVVRELALAPTVEALPVVRGFWEKSDIPCEGYKCSICGGAAWYYDYQGEVAKSRFCPNCGAKMDV